ncbi:hypothetical protein D6827_00060 [Candidatus Parcubacteria bacterium]|nr:MAG: hypothetical protein D6827_00060 [Candidatus Parcubacteria bacterium]
MPQHDMKNNMQIVHAGNLALSGTTAVASAWIDTRDFNAVTLAAVVNTVTDAGTVAGGFSFTMEESDSTADASATPVAATDIVGSLSDLTVLSDTADDSIAGTVGYVGNKRYVRLKAQGTTGTAADVSIIGICEEAGVAPPVAVGTAVAAT